MMAELTEKFCQYFGRLDQKKKTEKKVWPSWLGRVGFGRVVWQSNEQLIFFKMLIISHLRVSKLVETVERKMLCLLPCTSLAKAVVYANDLGLDPRLIP
jgi:hypothetical protein